MAMPYNSMGSYQAQQYFPSPQGNVYFINSSMELANIPMSSNLSLAICMSENMFYIKTLQNGAPTVMAYSFDLYEPKPQAAPDNGENKVIADLEERLLRLEKQFEKNNLGGSLK